MADFENFNVDPKILQNVREQLKGATEDTRNLSAFMKDFVNELGKAKDTSLGNILSQVNQISKALQEQNKNASDALLIENQKKIIQIQLLLNSKELTNQSRQQLVIEKERLIQQSKFVELGVSASLQSKISTKLTEDSVKARGGELVTMRSLTAEARKRVELEVEKANAVEKYVKLANGEIVKVNEGDKQKSTFDKRTSAAAGGLVTQGAGVVGLGGVASAAMAVNPAGLAAAAVGLLTAKAVKGLDMTNRLSAQAKQATMHWAEGESKLSDTQEKIQDISSAFQITLDEAGKYVKTLGQAGLSYEQMDGYSVEFLARQAATGQSIESQLATVKGITQEYGGTDRAASAFLTTILAVQKTLPMLSMDQIRDDIFAINDSMKMFNTNALGGVTIYKTLMRDKKDLEKAGLTSFAAMPQEYRKQLAQTMAGISTNMSLGMKAYYGAQMPGGSNKTPAQNIIAYENLITDDKKKGGMGAAGAFEQMKIMTTTWAREAQNIRGDAEKEIHIRKQAELAGVIDPRLIQVLARTVAGGGLDSKEWNKVQASIKSEQPPTAADAAKGTADIIAAGKDVQNQLITRLDALNLAADNMVQLLYQNLQDAKAETKQSGLYTAAKYNRLAQDVTPAGLAAEQQRIPGADPSMSDPIKRLKNLRNKEPQEKDTLDVALHQSSEDMMKHMTEIVSRLPATSPLRDKTAAENQAIMLKAASNDAWQNYLVARASKDANKELEGMTKLNNELSSIENMVIQVNNAYPPRKQTGTPTQKIRVEKAVDDGT